MKSNTKYLALKGYRIMHGLSSADMAQVIGKSVSTYRKKENGKSDFYLSEVMAMCDKLGMSADIFLKRGLKGGNING